MLPDNTEAEVDRLLAASSARLPRSSGRLERAKKIAYRTDPAPTTSRRGAAFASPPRSNSEADRLIALFEKNRPASVTGTGRPLRLVSARPEDAAFLLKKKVVEKIGVDNLRAVNSGLMGFGHVLAGLQKPAYAVHTASALTMPIRPASAPVTASSSPVVGRDLLVNVLSKDEPLSTSLPRTVRNLAHLKRGR